MNTINFVKMIYGSLQMIMKNMIKINIAFSILPLQEQWVNIRRIEKVENF